MRAFTITGVLAIATALVSLGLPYPWNWIALFVAVPLALFTMGLAIRHYVVQ